MGFGNGISPEARMERAIPARVRMTISVSWPDRAR